MGNLMPEINGTLGTIINKEGVDLRGLLNGAIGTIGVTQGDYGINGAIGTVRMTRWQQGLLATDPDSDPNYRINGAIGTVRITRKQQGLLVTDPGSGAE